MKNPARRQIPQLVAENFRKEVRVFKANHLALAVRGAFGVYVVPLGIESYYNDKGRCVASQAVMLD